MKFAIIAAGRGSRLAKDGVDVPKPMVDLDGQPMIGRLIDIMSRCGARRIAVIVSEAMPTAEDYLRTGVQRGDVAIDLIIKTTEGSNDSLRAVTAGCTEDDKYVVATVDTVFGEADFRRYVDYFAACDDQADGCMAVSRFVDDEKPLWVAADAEGRITAFSDEQTAATQYVSAGVYGLKAKALGVLDRCLARQLHSLRDYQRALVEVGLHLHAFDMGKVIDVDRACDVEAAKEFISTLK